MVDQVVVTDELVKVYGPVRALNDVSIRINRGEVFAVLGPNGAGKTTLMRILTTQIKPTSGRALVMGYDVVNEDYKVRRVIGYVPQEFSVWTDLTGYEDLLIYAKIYGIPRREVNGKIKEVLEFMDLVDASRRLVNTYSGGMVRRLEIATALLTEPEVLFLDEPTVGLDPAAREIVWDRLTMLNKERGITIVFNSHYMDEVELYAGRVAMLNKGKVVIQGTVDELKRTVGGEVIELTVNSVEDAVGLTHGLDAGVKEVNTDGGRGVIRVIVDNADVALPILIKALQSHGIDVRRVSMFKPTLDDVFLRYVGGRITEEGRLSELRAIRAAVKRG